MATPLKSYTPGAAVVIETHNGKFIGTGYVNPNSLICARLVSRDKQYCLDRSLIIHRIKVALSLRTGLFKDPYYRLIYGESDSLPGLVIDRFNDVFVVQLTTAGMEHMKQDILDALEKVFRPRAVLLRNDNAIRKMEGLDSYIETLGDLPEEIELPENDVRFRFQLQGGQKTGWFYDQRMNRTRMAAYIKGKRVLDVFSYVGAWGVQAAVKGASDVVCVDSSQTAIDAVQQNAELNHVTEKLSTLQGDAFQTLSHLRDQGEKFDVVILDPPAFIKRRKDMKAGEQAYHRINQLGMRLLNRDGLLISASCSQHLTENQLQKTLLQDSRHLDRQLQILERGHQGPDHPVHPAIPETAYLKAFFCRLLPS